MNYKYDWQLLQKDYDSGLTWQELRDKHHVAMATLAKSLKRGDFKSRSKSVANKLARKKHPESFKRSEETRAKISKARKAYLKAHPDQVPYLLNHSSKESYPEKYFAEVFEQEGLIVEKEFKVDSYSLDFAIPSKWVDIEVDGDQHFLDERIAQHDIKRTKNLEKQGWKVLRIKWSDYQKLNFDEKKKFVKDFIKKVNNC